MGCEECQELLSARLDGEDEAGRAAEVDAHLARCPRCRQWFDRAAMVTRMTRMAPALPGPDLADAVLAQVELPRRARGLGLRCALGAVGVLQCLLGLATLALAGSADDHHDGEVFGAAVGHLSHESAAWNLALGVAFLWAALRVNHLPGLVPVLATFTVTVLGLSLVDLGAGRVDEFRVVAHLLTLLGLVLVVRLTHLSPPSPVERSGGGWLEPGGGAAPEEAGEPVPRLGAAEGRSVAGGAARLSGRRVA